jgi:hypothetical protein
MASNVTFQSRNVLSKKLLVKKGVTAISMSHHKDGFSYGLVLT